MSATNSMAAGEIQLMVIPKTPQSHSASNSRRDQLHSQYMGVSAKSDDLERASQQNGATPMVLILPGRQCKTAELRRGSCHVDVSFGYSASTETIEDLC